MAPKAVKAAAKPAAKSAKPAAAAAKPAAKKAAKPAQAASFPAADLAALRPQLAKDALALVDGPELKEKAKALFERFDHGGPDGSATGSLEGPWLAKCEAALAAPERKAVLGPGCSANRFAKDGELTEAQLVELVQWTVAAEASHYFAAGPGGDKALAAALDELCTFYDAPGDGAIERKAFFAAEEELCACLEGPKSTLGPKERRELLQWWKTLQPAEKGGEHFVAFAAFKQAFPERVAARGPQYLDEELLPLDPRKHSLRFAEWLSVRVLEPFRAKRRKAAPAAKPGEGPAPEPPPTQQYPVQVPLRGLKDAIEVATPQGWYDYRRTVLTCAGGQKGVQTFLSYNNSYILVDCKELIGKMFVEKSMTKDDARDLLRNKVKYCLCTDYHDCRSLWLRLGTSAFALQDFVGPEGLPAALFEPGFTPQKALDAGLISEAHAKHLDAKPDVFGEFRVLISSDFDLAGVQEHLAGLPGFASYALLDVRE